MPEEIDTDDEITTLLEAKLTQQIRHQLENHTVWTWKKKINSLFDVGGFHPSERWERAAQVLALVSLLFIITSSSSFCIESWPEFSSQDASDATAFRIIEGICVGYFTLELLIRFFVCPNRKDFILDVANIIDLLAILPYYVELVVRLLVQQSGAHVVKFLVVFRLLRLTRIFRVFKISRYSETLRMVWMTIQLSKDALFLMAFLLTISTLVFSSLIYTVEQLDSTFDMENEQWVRADGTVSPFQSVPATFWFTIVSLTTVGYGDAYPVTQLGRFIGAGTMLTGLLVIAFPAILIGSNFSNAQEAFRRASKLRQTLKRSQSVISFIQKSGSNVGPVHQTNSAAQASSSNTSKAELKPGDAIGSVSPTETQPDGTFNPRASIIQAIQVLETNKPRARVGHAIVLDPVRADSAFVDNNRKPPIRYVIHCVLDSSYAAVGIKTEIAQRVAGSVMLFFILVSIISFCISTYPSLYATSQRGGDSVTTALSTIDLICVFVFLGEFLVRLVTTPSQKRFWLSPFTMIDILSFAPPLLERLLDLVSTNLRKRMGFLILLRTLRLTRVMRAFRLSRYSLVLNGVIAAFKGSAHALILLVFLVGMGLVIFGSAIFYAEQSAQYLDANTLVWYRKEDNSVSPFQHIPGCFWFCIVTMTTVGYGDAVPVTFAGKLIASLCACSGILVLAFPISIIGAAFQEHTTMSGKRQMQRRMEHDRSLRRIEMQTESMMRLVASRENRSGEEEEEEEDKAQHPTSDDEDAESIVAPLEASPRRDEEAYKDASSQTALDSSLPPDIVTVLTRFREMCQPHCSSNFVCADLDLLTAQLASILRADCASPSVTSAVQLRPISTQPVLREKNYPVPLPLAQLTTQRPAPQACPLLSPDSPAIITTDQEHFTHGTLLVPAVPGELPLPPPLQAPRSPSAQSPGVVGHVFTPSASPAASPPCISDRRPSWARFWKPKPQPDEPDPVLVKWNGRPKSLSTQGLPQTAVNLWLHSPNAGNHTFPDFVEAQSGVPSYGQRQYVEQFSGLELDSGSVFVTRPLAHFVRPLRRKSSQKYVADDNEVAAHTN